jgi:hypothetical protein
VDIILIKKINALLALMDVPLVKLIKTMLRLVQVALKAMHLIKKRNVNLADMVVSHVN